MRTCNKCGHESEYVQTYNGKVPNLDLCNHCAEKGGYKDGWVPPPADNQVGLMVTFLIIGLVGGWILNSVFTAIGGI